jgi:ubiquitin conjugation factor E4 B
MYLAQPHLSRELGNRGPVSDNSLYYKTCADNHRVNLDFFVQFVNLLLNDVTYVLDESFTAFTQIHDLTKELRSPPEDLDANERQEKEEKLSAAKDKAKGYMQLTNETVAMLKLFTEALGDSFTKKEVVVRLAHMLDYNLEALVGPKKANLKVENPGEYGWNPRQMLSEIADVYLNLKDKRSFVDSVATDGRSYRPEYFATAMQIMQKFALKAPEQLQDWENLAERIKSAKEEAEIEEADLGDIPDEYMDPLLATLMEDPVILPTSKQVLDRSTVASHLLSDPHDPFNRMPLSLDQVIPNDSLREEIQKWKADRLAMKMAERQAANVGEPMDTS